MQQGKRRIGRAESFQRDVQHHARVLAHRIEHDGLGELGHRFANDCDCLGLQLFQIRRKVSRSQNCGSVEITSLTTGRLSPATAWEPRAFRVLDRTCMGMLSSMAVALAREGDEPRSHSAFTVKMCRGHVAHGPAPFEWQRSGGKEILEMRPARANHLTSSAELVTKARTINGPYWPMSHSAC